MKIAINRCYGGFGLSQQATKRYLELKGKECFFYTTTRYDGQQKVDDIEANPTFLFTYTKDFGKTLPHDDKITNEYFFSEYEIPRNDPDLIKAIEELGAKASNRLSELKVIEIPDGVEYVIEEYDGIEWISEKHRTWGDEEEE